MNLTRFAPSPTGRLHLGHAYSALVAASMADRFLLRIEDIDPTRCRREHETALLDDLRWLGLVWPEPVWRQSERFGVYRTALDRLEVMGLLYPCFCTRRQVIDEATRSGVAPHGPEGVIYAGTCRKLSVAERRERTEEEPYALRLDMEKGRAMAGPLRWHDREAGWIKARPELFGDVILARKETPTSYHLAVTVDDGAQGVTLVARGADLFDATHIHVLLQKLLDLTTPDYYHHPLITGDDGRRLAKRDRSVTIGALRDGGATPDDIRRRFGPLP